MALALDRKAFIDILTEGQGQIGGAMQPPPEGLWGMPPEMLKTLPGYGPDVAKNRAEARQIMEKLGYGPDKRLQIKVIDPQRPALPRPGGDPDRPAEGDLYRRRARNRRHRQWYPKVMRKDYTVGLNLTESGVDDPDRELYENYACGSGRQLQRLLQPRGRQADRPAIDGGRPGEAQAAGLGDRAKLAEDGARPIIYFSRGGDLLAAPRQGADDHGQQHLQRLADGGRLARQISGDRSESVHDDTTAGGAVAATARLLAAISARPVAALGAESRRRSEDLSPRQPGQHVDPRGGDAFSPAGR